MDRTAGEVPYQPCVHGPEYEVTRLRGIRCPGDVVQDPPHLGSGEVRVYLESGPPEDLLRISALPHALAYVGGPPVLPNDGVMDGGAGVAVPYYHGLTLVGYAECDTFSRIYPGFGEAIGNRPPAELPDLHGIVLHHTRTRIMLCERLLGYGEDRSPP